METNDGLMVFWIGMILVAAILLLIILKYDLKWFGKKNDKPENWE